jgi:predicted DNA-binding protein YlxM (UPF0122 family)
MLYVNIKPKKHNYHILTEEDLVYIQQCLNKRQSINLIAKKLKISRTTIYSAINSGKLVFKRKKV